MTLPAQSLSSDQQTGASQEDAIQAQARAMLKETFGYEQFRPYQAEIIGNVLRGCSQLLVMPTGGGKSMCYQLPALLMPGLTVVVSPLISLMQDQVRALRQLGVQAAFLNSSLNRSEQRSVLDSIEAGTLDLLYVAPERLLKPVFLEKLQSLRLALIAIDEAHCISQWGHDFRPEYLQLSRVRGLFRDVPLLAVTATADEPTRAEIIERLDIPEEGLTVTGFDRPNISYHVQVKRKAKQSLLRFITEQHAGDAGIVYCQTRNNVEKVTEFLLEEGIEAVPYHAGLSSRVRQANQRRFILEEGLIVVATVAFGMGIDKPNVRFVVHMEVPKSPEAYYQETGRAGRDGLPATAFLMYRLADVVMMRKIMESSGREGQHSWVEHHKLNAMVGYCESATCRRKVLLNYFGEAHDGACDSCDNCLNPVDLWDGTIAAQKVMSCVARTGQRFGASHVADVLLGKETAKVKRFRHDQLPTFGVGEDLPLSTWRSVIRQLVAAELLSVDVTGYGALHLTPACEPVLKGEQSVELRKDPTPKRASRKKKQTSTAERVLPQTEEARALYEHLRSTRLELAREQGVPPYVIFPDSTLIAMVQEQPTTMEAFHALPGVGAIKLEKYGTIFLDALQG